MKRFLFLSLFLTCIVSPAKAANINDATLINTKQLTQNVVFVDKYATIDLCATTTGAIDQIGSTVTTLIISEAVTCTLNKTVPSTLTFQFMGQGLITISSTKTLTVYSPEHIVAPTRSKIVAGGGLLAFTRGGTIHPGWWGAVFDGSTNDATAIQAAITAAPTKSRIALPGIAAIGTAGLLVSGKTDFVIDGQEGIGGIKALGVSTQTVVGSTVLAVKSCTRCVVTGLRFDGNAIASNLIGIQDSSDSEISHNSTTSGGTNAAIMAVGNTRNRYLHNTVQDTIGAARGMWIGNTNTVELETDPLVLGNTVRSTSASGFVFVTLRGRVQGNLAEGTQGSGFTIAAAASAGNATSRLILTGNTARTNLFHGFQSDGSVSTDRTVDVELVGNLSEQNQVAGFYVVRASGWILANNIARDNSEVGVSQAAGFSVEQSERITLTGNYAYDSKSGASRKQSVGIDVLEQAAVNGTHDVVVTGNFTYNNRDYGIAVRGVGAGTVTGVTVTGNAAIGNGDSGIVVKEVASGDVSGVIVSGNVATSNTTRDLRFEAKTVTVGVNSYVTSTGVGWDATYAVLPNNDTTPSIKGRTDWVVNNSGGTTITMFDDGVPGQTIQLLFTNTNTTVTDGGNIKLSGAFTSSADDTMRLIFDGTNWYELNRSVN